MIALVQNFRRKLGDFWWHSLLIFAAARVADVLNVCVGLYLVPKYVDPTELGAVLPLTQFATILALPVTIFASTFRQELSSLALARRFGEMKTLIRGVFIATAIFFVIAIVVSDLVLPFFLSRIRIAKGSLGILILITAFATTLSPVFTNTLQALKKFSANALINFLGAPLRLVAMVLTMPFRAISGYFVGQMATPLFNMAASVLALRRELSVPAEPYWNRNVAIKFSKFFFFFACGTISCALAALLESTILRERVPEVESAAYYVITRFSDIAGFLAMALGFTLFPYSADLAAKGQDTRPLALKVMFAVFGSNLLLAALFAFVGPHLIALLPHGESYAAFAWALPCITLVTSVSWCANLYTTVEVASGRFRYLIWWAPLHIIYALALMFSPSLTSLAAMIVAMAVFNVLKLACALLSMSRRPTV